MLIELFDLLTQDYKHTWNCEYMLHELVTLMPEQAGYTVIEVLYDRMLTSKYYDI